MLDLELRNARILTMDKRRPIARRIGILHGHIVGLDEEIDGLTSQAVIDCDGAVIVPGFADAHNHMAWYGFTLSELDLSACKTLNHVYDLVAARAAALGSDSWIIGYGYDAGALGGHPERRELDRAGGGRPVWLRHRSGHICSVSSWILERAGVLGGRAEDPAGGRVIRDADGEPTGELQEQAQRLVTQVAGAYSTGDLAQAIARAAKSYVAEGLTHVTEAGIGGGWIGHSPIEAAAYMDARENRELPLRVELMVASDALHSVSSHPKDRAKIGIDLGLRSGFGDDMLSIGPMKIFVDGSMTGHTAALSDALHHPGHPHGYLQDDPIQLAERIIQAHVAGWRVAAHAIGDRALDLALDAVEAAQRIRPRLDVRHRVEHAAVTRPDQIDRMVQLGIVPVIQGRFVHEVGEAASEWVGLDNLSTLLRHRSFVDAGLIVAGSSDRPVVLGASPLLGMQAMVERIGQGGHILSESEGVDAAEALRAYTVNAAWASHAEHHRGRLAPGFKADLVLLDDDPTTVPTSAIGGITVLSTFVAGRCVFGVDEISGRTRGTATAGTH